MELLQKQTQETEDFLDDCVAMVEALRCMKEKGAEGVDPAGVTLKTEVFDRCFPGVEWKEVRTKDGKFIGIYEKIAEYRGFEFGTVKEADE